VDQLSLSHAEYRGKRKQTRRERFLSEMEQGIPWKRLERLIEPHYPKAGNGRQPYPLAMMPRIHLLQQWYGLSDPAAEDALYEITSMRQFAGLSLSRHRMPDESTILQFRHLLVKTPADRGAIRRGQRLPARQGADAQARDPGRCHHHRRAQFHEEQGTEHEAVGF
jgi:IS5 family transposase